MIVDVRTYTLAPRKTAEYLKLFEAHGLPVQMKHLGSLIGYYASQIGPLNQVVHIWGYESLADMEKRRAARDADPAWAEYQKKTEGFVIAQDNKIMKPAPFSPTR
jgi:hypothetical protein